LVAGACGQATLATGGAARADELTIDSRIVSGTLENGLKYYVMPHNNPPKRAIVWMQVSTGSLNETDKQRGIAHYLEHMAFNGSKNFPPGTVVKYFESLGLTFGRHINASTSFSETNYQLPLPDNSIDKIRQALLFMSDVNGRLLIEPGEIDAERQIILEEKTSRKSARQRIMDYIYTRMAPGSIYGERLPIGTEETILGVQRADFVDYYTKYYTPSNSTIIVVGEVDAAAVVAEIKSSFADLSSKPLPKDQEVGIKGYEKAFAVVATDAEMTRASVGMMRVSPPVPAVTTNAQLREEMVQALATAAFNRVVQEKVTEGKVSFLGAIAFASNVGDTMWQMQAQASGDPAKVGEMLTDLGVLVQRARLHGFTEHAIDDARKDMMARAEQQAQQELTLPAMAHVRRIGGAIGVGEPVRSAAQRLESAQSLLPSITAAECSAWFAREFDPTAVMFFAMLPSTGAAFTEETLMAAGAKAFSVTPAKEDEAKRAEVLLEKLPTPGTVVEQAEHAASGVWSGWLSNGVRLHHRFMDYRRNDASIDITFYGGGLLESEKDRGIGGLATQAWSQAATRRLTSLDMRSLMTGKKVRVGGGDGDDSLSVSVSGSPEELEFGMQAAYLLLSEPLLEETAVTRWKVAQLQSIEGVTKSPSQYFGRVVSRTVYPASEVRTQALTKPQVEALTREAAQAWLDKQLATAPIEVSIVGDIPREKAIELATRYVGSLATRARVDSTLFADKRKLTKGPLPAVAMETMQSQTDAANVLVAFYGPDLNNTADVRALNMASRILSSRMVQEIREKRQLVYSIGASLTPGSTYPGFGVFRAGAPTQPEKVPALIKVIGEMYDAFAKDGPTEEEMQVGKGQFANNYDEQTKEPGYWSSVTQTMTFDGRSLDDVLETPAAVQSLTALQVQDAFKKYYSREALITVGLTPTK